MGRIFGAKYPFPPFPFSWGLHQVQGLATGKKSENVHLIVHLHDYRWFQYIFKYSKVSPYHCTSSRWKVCFIFKYSNKSPSLCGWNIDQEAWFFTHVSTHPKKLKVNWGSASPNLNGQSIQWLGRSGARPPVSEFWLGASPICTTLACKIPACLGNHEKTTFLNIFTTHQSFVFFWYFK